MAKNWSDEETSLLLSLEGRRRLVFDYGRTPASIATQSSFLKIKEQELSDRKDGKFIYNITSFERYISTVNKSDLLKISGYNRAQYLLRCLVKNYVPTTFEFFLLNISLLRPNQYATFIFCMNYRATSNLMKYDYLNRIDQMKELWESKYNGVTVEFEVPVEEQETLKLEEAFAPPPLIIKSSNFTLDLFGLKIEIQGESVSPTELRVTGINISKSSGSG